MKELLLLLILCLASHRVTRFITRDSLALISVPREKFVARWAAYDDAPPEMKNISVSGKKTNIFMRSLTDLWECDWCMGVWVSGGLVALATTFTGLPWPWWVTTLAVASVVGLIANRIEK